MSVIDPKSDETMSITVGDLLNDPALQLRHELLAGKEGLTRLITHPRIQKSGLALLGHLHGVVSSRIQVLGETELSYAESLDERVQREAAENLFSLELALVVVTRGVSPPAPFIEAAKRTQTPLVVCEQRSSVAITALHTLLDERLAPRVRLHGVLIDVFEVGVLLLGKSGIGKSECALELLMRGHRLVADDVIDCDFRPPGMIFGQPAPLLRHYIEVRGLGILNIKDLYGVTAVRERKRLDLIVRLELWRPEKKYDRIGVEDHYQEVLGVPIREVCLPVQPGRNMSSIVEIAARNELLRQAGHHPARDLVSKIEAGLLTTNATGEKINRPPSRTFRAIRPNESSAPPPVAPRLKREEEQRFNVEGRTDRGSKSGMKGAGK